MNARQLEAFRAVIDTGTVTRAAEVLRISQPAVSKLIGLLAKECGFALFQRRGSRITPTPEALVLFSEVERMFVGTARIARHAADIRSLRAGQLSIAAFPAIATRTLPRLITRFLADHPDAHVSLVSRSSRPLVDWVAAQQVDLGIGLLAIDQPGVRFEHFAAFDGVCVLPPGHRLCAKRVVQARDLQGERFISLGTEDRSRFLVDQVFERLGVRRAIAIESQQSESACAFVANGAGVAIVEPFSASEFTPDQLVVRPFRPAVRFSMWLLFPAYRTQSLMTRAFIETLAQDVRALTGRGPAR